jgi:hypothetical protein
MWGCEAALRGLTPHAALSMSWSFTTSRRAKHHGASPSSTYVSATEKLRAARGVSPFKRPAAPLCSLLTVRSEPQVSTWGRRVAQPRSVSAHPDAPRLPPLPAPMHNLGAPLPTPMIHLSPPLPTPMHHAYRLFPPRCTSPTASTHPDAQQKSPLPTPMHNVHRLFSPRCTTPTASSHPDAPRLPPIPTPMHIAYRLFPPR